MKPMRYVTGNKIYPRKMLQHALFYRELALEVDRDPRRISEYFGHTSLKQFTADENLSCLERTKKFECLSYGDVGVLLASPGPSLAGQMIKELGNADQNRAFFEYVTSRHARTFLAVTEPGRGSDAANLTTKIICNESNNKFMISGEKCFVGNGAVGEIGVVIARRSNGPLGMVAVMIIPGLAGTELSPHLNIKRRTIPTVGLHGASLSHLVFDDYPIEREQILGDHLHIVNRGMIGLIKTFNRMRTCVGALAIGLSQAVLDYAYDERQNLNYREQNIFLELSAEVCAARNILYAAASRIDDDVTDSASASLAKVIATKTAEKVVSSILELFNPDVFWEHPLIEKWHRDVYGFEFMEGTMQIHYKNVAQKYYSDRKVMTL